MSLPAHLAAHIRARLAETPDHTPAIELNRAGWEAILTILDRETKRGEHLKGARGDSHPRSKAVITPEGRYGSAAIAAEAHGINPSNAQRRASKGLFGWRFETSDK